MEEVQNNKGWRRASGHGLGCEINGCINVNADYIIGNGATSRVLCYEDTIKFLDDRKKIHSQRYGHYYGLLDVSTALIDGAPIELLILKINERESFRDNAERDSTHATQLKNEISLDHSEYLQQWGNL